MTQTAVSLTLFLIAFHPTVHSKWYCTTSIRNFLAYIKIHIQSCDVGRFARSWKYELGKSSLFNSAKFARLPSFRYLPPQRNEGGMWIVDRPTRLLSLRIKRNETVFKRVPARAGQRNRRRSPSVSLSGATATAALPFLSYSPYGPLTRMEGGKVGRLRRSPPTTIPRRRRPCAPSLAQQLLPTSATSAMSTCILDGAASGGGYRARCGWPVGGMVSVARRGL